MDKTGSTFSPNKHARDLNGSPMQYYTKQVQVKPALLEGKFTGNQNFDSLPENFKKIFTNDKKDQEMRLPVVGYGGHRKGEKAENMFAKNYRETTLMAARNKR